jgi:hypothetical protein
VTKVIGGCSRPQANNCMPDDAYEVIRYHNRDLPPTPGIVSVQQGASLGQAKSTDRPAGPEEGPTTSFFQLSTDGTHSATQLGTPSLWHRSNSCRAHNGTCDVSMSPLLLTSPLSCHLKFSSEGGREDLEDLLTRTVSPLLSSAARQQP